MTECEQTPTTLYSITAGVNSHAPAWEVQLTHSHILLHLQQIDDPAFSQA